MLLLNIYCDHCYDAPARVANEVETDPYYGGPVEHYCDDCFNALGDKEPDYDVVTATESYQQAHDDRQRLRGFKS